MVAVNHKHLIKSNAERGEMSIIGDAEIEIQTEKMAWPELSYLC